jgi:hypothetical protein
MKKVLLYIMTLVLAIGCQSIDNNKTTYTFVCTDGTIEDIVASGWEMGYSSIDVQVLVSEYFQGQRVATNLITDVVSGREYTREANMKTEYITIRVDVDFSGSSKYEDLEFDRYIANVFYLNIGEDTRIEFNGNTIVSQTEPK